MVNYQMLIDRLSQSEAQLDFLVESVTEYAIFGLGLDGTIASWNIGGMRLFGYTEAAIIGQHVGVLFSAEDRARGVPSAQLEQALCSGVANIAFTLVRADGTRFRASGKINALRHDPGGIPQGFVQVVHDITEVQAAYEHERLWSNRFQRAILPGSLPAVVGLEFDAFYESGQSEAPVGGDWYDVVQLLDGRVLVTIGDVSGRGLEAAVVVGVVRQIMRGIAQLHADPALVLDAADRALAMEYPEVYVTAWVAILDLATCTLTYACAGHPPALLVDTGGNVRELGGGQLPIGLREGVRGESVTLAWAQGDTLVLYTDGLTEAERDLLASQTRLCAVVAQIGQGAFARPVEAIKAAVIPHGSSDDVAILVVRVDFVAYERQVDRWQLATDDAGAAYQLRHRFTASLASQNFSAEDVGYAEVIFGELIGNVMRHAGGDYHADVLVDHSGPRTVLHVLDAGCGFEFVSRLPHDIYSETGRGLFLISALTADFQVDRRTDGGSHARAVLHGRLPVRFAK